MTCLLAWLAQARSFTLGMPVLREHNRPYIPRIRKNIHSINYATIKSKTYIKYSSNWLFNRTKLCRFLKLFRCKFQFLIQCLWGYYIITNGSVQSLISVLLLTEWSRFISCVHTIMPFGCYARIYSRNIIKNTFSNGLNRQFD